VIHSSHSSAPDRPAPVRRGAPRRAEAPVRPLDFLSRHPIAVLVVLAVAFACWVATDATAPRPKPTPAVADSLEPPMTAEIVRMRTVGAALREIHEGMPRADVEARLGRPLPKDIRPVERANGRATYRTHYAAFLSTALALSPNVVGYCEVVLEYDAASPGHPLLGVTAIPRGAPGAATSAGVA
jgi:hypothetical protein